MGAQGSRAAGCPRQAGEDKEQAGSDTGATEEADIEEEPDMDKAPPSEAELLAELGWPWPSGPKRGMVAVGTSVEWGSTENKEYQTVWRVFMMAERGEMEKELRAGRWRLEPLRLPPGRLRLALLLAGDVDQARRLQRKRRECRDGILAACELAGARGRAYDVKRLIDDFVEQCWSADADQEAAAEAAAAAPLQPEGEPQNPNPDPDAGQIAAGTHEAGAAEAGTPAGGEPPLHESRLFRLWLPDLAHDEGDAATAEEGKAAEVDQQADAGDAAEQGEPQADKTGEQGGADEPAPQGEAGEGADGHEAHKSKNWRPTYEWTNGEEAVEERRFALWQAPRHWHKGWEEEPKTAKVSDISWPYLPKKEGEEKWPKMYAEVEAMSKCYPEFMELYRVQTREQRDEVQKGLAIGVCKLDYGKLSRGRARLARKLHDSNAWRERLQIAKRTSKCGWELYGAILEAFDNADVDSDSFDMTTFFYTSKEAWLAAKHAQAAGGAASSATPNAAQQQAQGSACIRVGEEDPVL
ncbi:hypothetical protein WJX81_001735 [Elliptochloris bilobata]|uniref:Uncharacterized protein n=1 Tax=Elliptochloris bilobata TaxID=381761 RepID=A0AAW1QWD1_9CHLO